jgi:methylated-DNA-protein-cysteine methyltransferase-like protein
MVKKDSSVFVQVYKIVRKIPSGRVTTYGAISRLLNGKLSAQGVGWALNALKQRASKGQEASKDSFHSGNVPWHRVINSQGGISTSNNVGIPQDYQRTLLEAEGIKFTEDGRVELGKYLFELS